MNRKVIKTMFCPKCGAANQSAESYCKRCGEWLPDIEDIHKPRLFRKSSRQEKIRKMRFLEVLSATLSLTAAVIIISVLAGGENRQILIIAAIFNFLVVVYQIVNFYFGHKIQQKTDTNRTEGIKEIKTLTEREVGRLDPVTETHFVINHSVIDNTTELLEPIPQKTKREN